MHRLLQNRRSLNLVCVMVLLISTIGLVLRSAGAHEAAGVTTLTGAVTVTSPYILRDTGEPHMLLLDMTAYVKRDLEVQAPLRSQIVAPLEGNLAEGASFALHLPITPEGRINDVDHGESDGSGVQIYSVEFWANSFDDPFVGPHEGGGWGTTLTSLVVTPGDSEVIGGTVVVWAPDDRQLFSTDFGPDGRFLTSDDPVGPIPAGWTVVDLNQSPFQQIRTPEVEVTIVEGDDGYTDYSQLSFTEAFTALVDELELRYPYTVEKGLDWGALRAEYSPRVEDAEAADDLLAFNIVLYDFANEFNDGHVGVLPPPELFAEQLGGRLGMRLAETDDGKVIVISVTEGLPADEAGIELGAVVSTWNGLPIADAVLEEEPFFAVSSPHVHRLKQFEFLTRGAVGDDVTITFTNPGDSAQTAVLTFSEDIEGRDVAANTKVSFGNYNPGQLPVESRLLDSGIGYIYVNTFFADPIMMSSAWKLALSYLYDAGAVGLIVDVRDNTGGNTTTAFYFAGSFYDEPFELHTSEFIDAEGTRVDLGSTTVRPAPVQWDLPVALLIDDGCVSACEYFAAAMAEDPSHLLVGYHPTAGMEAGVNWWLMPGGIEFQASIYRSFRDGELFLEGIGVSPNVEVPATKENLLNPEDEVLLIAEEALGPQIEAYFAELEAEAAATPEASPVGEATPVS